MSFLFSGTRHKYYYKKTSLMKKAFLFLFSTYQTKDDLCEPE
jgi:hypothetical protein